MARAALLALLALATAAPALAGEIAFGVHGEMTVAWTTDELNITMRVTCNPPNGTSKARPPPHRPQPPTTHTLTPAPALNPAPKPAQRATQAMRCRGAPSA